MSAADYRLMTEATGQRIAAALEALQLTGLGDPVTISHGGTGAATANGACENIGAVKKAGDTMTGALTINANITQPTGYISGDGTIDHAIKLGHNGDNVMEFNEYGGLYNFYRNASNPRELIFQISGSQGISAAPLSVGSGGTGMTGVTNGRTTAVGNYISGGDIYVNWCKWGPVVSVSGWFPIGTDVPTSEAFMTLPFAPIVYGAATAVNSNGTASRALYWNTNEKKLRARDTALPAYWWYTSFTYMTNE